MPWVRFEPDYPTHEKITPLSSLAKLLDVFGIMYSSAHLRDGRLSQTDIATVAALAGITRPTRALRELVEVNRWDAQTDGGYLIHDILQYQPPREQVLAERAAAAERKRDARAKGRPGQRPAGQPPDYGLDSGRSPATLVPGTGPGRPFGTSGDPPNPPAEQGGQIPRRRRKKAEPEFEVTLEAPEDDLACSVHRGEYVPKCGSCVENVRAYLDAKRNGIRSVVLG